MKKLIVAATVIIASLTAAKADIRENSSAVSTKVTLTQTVVNHFQAEANNNIVTLTWELTDANSNKEVEISIMNLEGATVYQTKATGSSSTIALDSNVPSGVYMVQISTGNVQRTKRIVIQ
ncbi:T9SS type A sorting domain-containing protein [Fulvivirga sp. M361]|uniref:T9SS type A sorting domain-containing protein n=1 Tax=Fulvivirga sp. M361 TaxID=2594266 RepID=UPI00162696AF|nr:T9SS type A sorting domain-containing protein [Fulvivirga sp. M361]